MSGLEQVLAQAARRVRFVRAVKGAGIGLFAGAALALVWVALDLAGIWFTEWLWIEALAAVCAVIGAILGFSWRLTSDQVAASLDRRAGLKDRVTAALESDRLEDDLASAVRADASAHLAGLSVKDVYPLRPGKWPMAAAACLAAAAMAFWFVNSGVLLSKAQKADKEKLEKLAADVKRVAKPLSEKSVDANPGKEERDLAKKLVDMARKLERGRMDKEEAMQKAQQLTDDAKKLADSRMDQAQQKMDSWQQQMAKQQFAKAGLDDEKLKQMDLSPEQLAMLQQMQDKAGVDPTQQGGDEQRMSAEDLKNMGLSDSAKEMMKMTSKERDALSKATQKEIDDIKKQLQNNNLSAEDRKNLEERMKQLQELMKDIKLSQDVYDAMKELQQSQAYKDLMKMMQQMQDLKAAEQKMTSGQKLTDEEMKELKEQLQQMQKDLEDWAQKMKDPEFRKQMEEQMKEMMEMLKNGELTAGQLSMCMGLFGMNGLMQMPGGPGDGGMNFGEGQNRKQERTEALKGTTNPFAVRGSRQEKGDESFEEIKAPTTVGNRTSVPYNKVLPKYKKSAESAMDGKKIPKKHEERVKEYFDSLSGGKSSSTTDKSKGK